MSSSDRAKSPSRRWAGLAGAMLAISFAAGCTVQPLHGTQRSTLDGSVVDKSQLSTIAIKPVNDRVGQEVRNHLIFMFGGGRGQPSNPVYQLDLGVSASASTPVTIDTGGQTLPPTAGVMIVRGDYRLTEIATGKVVATGARTVQAAYDIPQQQFAALRATRDAENRGAQELAQLLQLVIAQDLRKPMASSTAAPVSTPEQLEAKNCGSGMASF